MALKKQAAPKRWRSKEAKEIVAAVQRAGGQVERTASGHLKVIGPAGSAIVASAPNTGRAGGRAVHNTLATIRGRRPGCRYRTLGRACTLLQQFLELAEVGGLGVPDTWHGDSSKQPARPAEFQLHRVGDPGSLWEPRPGHRPNGGYVSLTPCMPCSFALLPHPRSGACAQLIDSGRLTGNDQNLWMLGPRWGDVEGRTLWVPVIWFTSCDLRVLMDQPTESISSHDPPSRHQRQLVAGPKWRRLSQGAVRAVAVVMVDVLGQHRPQLPAAQDQHPVQQLPPNRAHPPLRVGVGPRRPHRRAQHRIPSAAKTASNAAVNFVSRSRSRNRKRPTGRRAP